MTAGTLYCALSLLAAVEYFIIECDELGRPLPTPTPDVQMLPADDPWQPGDDEALKGVNHA